MSEPQREETEPETFTCYAFCYDKEGNWLRLTFETAYPATARAFDTVTSTMQEQGDFSRKELEAILTEFPKLSLVKEENAEVLFQEQTLRDGRWVTLREREEFFHGITHEFFADLVPLGITFYSVGEAALTFSPEPLIENAGHIKQAAATIPVFGPLGIEWKIAGRDFTRFNRLLHVQRNGSLREKTFHAATRELDAIPTVIDPHLTEEDKRIAKKLMAPNITGSDRREAKKLLRRKNGHKKQNSTFLNKGLKFSKDTVVTWLGIFNAKNGFGNLRNIFSSVAFATIKTVALPFNAELETKKDTNDELQQALISALPQDICESIALHHDPETGWFTVDEEKLGQQTEAITRRYRKRQLRSAGTASAMTGTTVFIESGCSLMYKTAAEDIPGSDAASAFLALSLIFATFVSTTLTLTPLKAAANKHMKHLERIESHREMLGTLRYIRDNQHNPQPSPFGDNELS